MYKQKTIAVSEETHTLIKSLCSVFNITANDLLHSTAGAIATEMGKINAEREQKQKAELEEILIKVNTPTP